MGMTLAQQNDCARQLAQQLFAGVGRALQGVLATAPINHNDLLAAVQALDAAFDTTLTNATAQSSGGTTVQNYLLGQIPSPASAGSATQKATLACYVILKRAGLI